MRNAPMQLIVELFVFYTPYFYMVLFATGVLFMFAARKLLKFGLKASIGFAIAVVVAILGIALSWVSAHAPGLEEHKYAESVVQAVIEEYPPLRRGASGEQQAIYMRPHPDRVDLYIYGVTAISEQNKVISIIRSLSPKKRVTITFYSKEKFIESRNSDGSISRKRIEQNPLRQDQVVAQ